MYHLIYIPSFPQMPGVYTSKFVVLSGIYRAAELHRLPKRLTVTDLNESLIDSWVEIVENPKGLCDQYETQ